MQFPIFKTERRTLFFALAVLSSLLAFNLYVVETTGIRAFIMVSIFVAALYLHTHEAIKEKAWKDLKLAALMLIIQIPAPLFGIACWLVFIGIELIVLSILLFNMAMTPARKSSKSKKEEQ